MTSTPKVAWYRKLLPLPETPRPNPQPATDPAAARERLAAVIADETDIPEATRTQLFEPEGDALATLVVWHGFTNAPTQFVPVAESLRAAGYRVLLPRMPHQGEADTLTKDLANLTVDELVRHVDSAIDIASGFGDPVWVMGLSAGGTLAGWAAATRPIVSRVVLAAPLVAPKGAPLWLVRLLARYPKFVPNFYFWWDPRVKAKIVGSPYAYPGFPTPGLIPYLILSESLFDFSVPVSHELDRVVLVSNPHDMAISRGAARHFGMDVFGPPAAYVAEATIDGALKWNHDFVDPWSPGTGRTDQVVAIFLAAAGASDPSAGGLLVAPLVQPQD